MGAERDSGLTHVPSESSEAFVPPVAVPGSLWLHVSVVMVYVLKVREPLVLLLLSFTICMIDM